MTGGGLVLPLALIEVGHLLDLLDEFVTVLEDSQHTADAGTTALAPDPYPDDREASAAFREATQTAILERRLADVGTVRAALAEAVGDATPEHAGEGLQAARVIIADPDLDAWLRTLTALRLMLASRLGVSGADDHDPEDPRFGVYDWLGFRLDQLVRAADARDGLDHETWI